MHDNYYFNDMMLATVPNEAVSPIYDMFGLGNEILKLSVFFNFLLKCTCRKEILLMKNCMLTLPITCIVQLSFPLNLKFLYRKDAGIVRKSSFII